MSDDKGSMVEADIKHIRTKETVGIPVKIVGKPEEVVPDIRVLVACDRMKATLQVITPQGCRPVTADEVMSKIKETGIVYGIDNTAIETAISGAGNAIVCASGLRPVDGDNAYITFHIGLENKGRPAELDGGRVDYKNLNMYTIVHKDELLAEKIPATLGTPGIDIAGNLVEAKAGKDVALPMGKNVYAVDLLRIHALQAGQMIIINGKINVVPVIEVKSDVNFSTGNIEFAGNVVVQGTVQAGFTVKAEGNIEITGYVSGGIVEGNNIIVRQGIQGMNRGYIKANENVIARYIENATVYAGNDIVVHDVILHSKINAAKRVIIEKRRGLIVGGRISAGEEIRAKTIGTVSATNTCIEVGVNPRLREEYQDLRKQVRKLETTLDRAKKALTVLKAADQDSLSAEKREILLKLTKTQFHLIGQIEMMSNRIVEIERALEAMRYGRIKVSDTVYPGVKLVVGTLVKPLRHILKSSCFYIEEGEIKIGSFNSNETNPISLKF